MTTKNKALAGLAATTVLLGQGLAMPSLGASATRLTKTSAAAIAGREARAGAIISSGDKIKVSNCRSAGHGAFKCQIELIPVKSTSRCRWTETVRLVRGKPTVAFSRVSCSD
ncbi:MAG: hypothetical protein QOF77_159 [Solirubrobacteraceae bacterium]|jgi:hypothetical protein|nr:hypothetical protein [Solirubrobacteraceae bacterium]